MRGAFSLLSVFIIGFGSSAFAARHATVDVDQTEIFRGPREDAGLVKKLKKGERLAASNYPTEGYYKVRTADGTIGWVKADTLILGEMPDLSQATTPRKR